MSAACVALPLFFSFATGSIAIPHNDDWAFLRILFRLADGGSIELVGWNEMTLVGHLFVALPFATLFGSNIAVVNTVTAVISGAGLFVLGAIARRFVEPAYALATVLIVAVFPGFAGLVATFMTDNTAFAAQMGCILVALIAFDREGRARDILVTASLAIGLFAFSIREFAILAPVATVGGYALANRRDGRSFLRAIVALVVLLVAAYALYRWRRTFEGDTSHYFRANFGLSMVPYLAQAFFTFSLAIAPAIIVALRRGVPPLVPGVLAAVVGIGLAFYTVQETAGSPTCCLETPGSVFLGNMFTARGTLGNQALFGDRPFLFPAPARMLLTVGAVAAGCAALALAMRWVAGLRLRTMALDPGVTTLALLGVAYAGAIVFRHALGGPLFDRYLLVPIAVAAILLLRGDRPRLHGAAKSALAVGVVLALASAVVVSSAAAWDAARWRAGETAVSAGIPAEDVDAGFEWVGWHYDGVANERLPRRSFLTAPGYMRMFPAAGNCGLVAASQQRGRSFDLIATIPYRQWFGARLERLWVYRFPAGCVRGRILRIMRGT